MFRKQMEWEEWLIRYLKSKPINWTLPINWGQMVIVGSNKWRWFLHDLYHYKATILKHFICYYLNYLIFSETQSNFDRPEQSQYWFSFQDGSVCDMCFQEMI